MTGRASKRKGSNGEREVVNLAKAAGLEAERAYASNGRALGMAEDVDALIAGLAVQVKRRAKIASYIKPPAGAAINVLREDRGEWLAVLPYAALLKLLANQEAA